MKYSEMMNINENFQYSVNLQFDINNITKIKEYIPTHDGCDLLKKYLESILYKKNRATTLVGPYGKGKSHLLLVLITILNDYEKADIPYINEFIEKIKNVDLELYSQLKQIRETNIKLMPIIINSNYDDLNQAFLIALSESLEREQLSNIVPKTYFDIALNVIAKWEDNYSEVISNFSSCLREYNTTVNKLKIGLKKYSNEHYEIFKNVYSCILHGQEFNPLVNSDIIKIYKDLVVEIQKSGYTGIFIIFDEFSKFLENSSNSKMMKDLKILQDFAELSNRTGNNEQIHLSCVTHKSLNQYSNNFDEDKINAFKTVEGRFKEIYFNRSLEQNYEIISYAIKKNEVFKEIYFKYSNKYKEFYNEIIALPIFKNVINICNVLFKGCFPINPITVYSLIALAEKIAQNERTLFTFLTDDDSNSLKSFIKQNEDGLFNINKVYDYFRLLLKKETDKNIKEIYIKAENNLKRVNNENESNIIKAITIIYIINETEIFTPDDNTIRLALNLTVEDYNIAINELINKSVLKKKKITNEVKFTTIYNNEASKQIRNLVETKYREINIRETINGLVERKYSLPRRYNEEYKMTRFFANIFITEEELLNLNSFEIIEDEIYCDGIILNLIRQSRNIQNVKVHFQNIAKDNIVLKIPKNIFSKENILSLKEYKSAHELINKLDTEKDILNELQFIIKETTEILDNEIKKYFSNENTQEYLYMQKTNKNNINESSYLSSICENIFIKSPIVNNEMINKNELSAPIKKARNIVIDTILSNNKDLIRSNTSAEATIYKSIVDKKDTLSIQDVMVRIKEFIGNSENKKVSFDELYSVLCNKPYSIRKGIIPILIAMAFYNYTDIVVIYFMNKEIDLNSENLVKINQNPEKYFLYIEKETSNKVKYLSSLMNIFNIVNQDTQYINLKVLVESMKKWILSLPRLVREINTEDLELNVKKEYILIKNELLKPDINNNQFIYKTILEIFNTDNYNDTIDMITSMKITFDNFMNKYNLKLIDKTKEIINIEFKGSISSLMKEWYQLNDLENSNVIYNMDTRNIIEYVRVLDTHNENDIIKSFSKILTGYYVEDWNSQYNKLYIEKLNNLINEINNNKNKIITEKHNKIMFYDENKNVKEKVLDSEFEISPIGNTMKNNIEELIEEYGEALTENEKVNILIDLMKKYM